MRIEDATYLVYEAKRWSEKAVGVGPVTMVNWQKPGAEQSPDKASISFISAEGVRALEKVFCSVGLKPTITIEPFPPGFSQEVLTGLRRSTTD